MTLTIEQLCIYPVKSMQGLNLNIAHVQESGFQFDRQFMITEPDGTFVTARQYHQLLLLQPAINEDGLIITAPNKQSIVVKYCDFSSQQEATEVWGSHFYSHIASINVNRWLSNYLQKDVQLRWVGKQLSRRIKRYPDISLSFADGYPFLLINSASFDYVQKRCTKPIKISQFRGNIIFDGAPAFAEDSWKTIKIGDVIFELVKPCSRCILTTIDVDTAQSNSQKEPLSVLANFRTDEKGEIDFGFNLIAQNKGSIKCGDEIQILEYKPAKHYIVKQSEPLIENRPIPSLQTQVEIQFQDKRFIGNNQQTILEQLEEHHIRIPYSCRAGICGRCQVTLTEGEVEPLTQNAVRRNQKILACSCLPKGNIKIVL